MLRPGELQFIRSTLIDGIPTRIFRDFYGARWTCMDFESARKREEQEHRTLLKQAEQRGDTRQIAYHKRRFVRRL